MKKNVHLKCLNDNNEWYTSYNNFINRNTCCSKCKGILKLTQEEAENNVRKKCQEKNYILLESFIYINNKTKLHLKCLNDNYEWYVTYNNFINNQGCPKCNNVPKITQEEALNKILQKCQEKNYILLNKDFVYINASKTRLDLQCNIDKYIWNTSYMSFIYQNSNCPKCSNVPKITQEEINFKVLKKCEEKKYILLESFIYKNNKEKNIHLKCLNDNYEWFTTYSELINGNSSCAKCAKNAKLSQQEVKEKVLKKCQEKKYTLLNKDFIYIGSKNTILILQCNKDTHIWNTNYLRFINNDQGCPKCGGNPKITQEEVLNKILENCKEKNCIFLNENFIYKTQNTKLNFICNICNHNWKTSYLIFIYYNSGCPKCGIEKSINTCIEKYGETFFHMTPRYNPNSIIYLDLISEKLNISIQHALNNGEKKFKRYWVDGYIEQYNICIEWQEQHHYTKKQKEKDLKREQYIINNFKCKIIYINEKNFYLILINK
jgi:hypothetical protein